MPTVNLNKRVVLVLVVAVILLIEAAWAIGKLARLRNETATSAPGVSPKTAQVASTATLSLQAPKSSLKVGEKVTVSILVSSPDVTDGTDVILNFNPKLLTVVLPSDSKSPVQTSTLFSDYPINSVDAAAGKVTVSGIVGTGKGITPNGILGTITFQANAPGKVAIAFDFTPGKTTDSNVIESGAAKDILTSVQNLELTITP